MARDRKRIVRGFTLIEVLVTLALGSLLLGAGLTESLSSYERTLAIHDCDAVRDALRQARARAIHSVCGSPCTTSASAHGVCLDNDEVTHFEGALFDSRRQEADERLVLARPYLTDAPISFVFSIPSARAEPADISLARPGEPACHIQVNAEGRIAETP